MGYDAACTLTIEGRTFAGTARLEEQELTFRGDARLVIPLATIDEVQARQGRLDRGLAGGRSCSSSERAAEKWARRIASPPSRIEKLGVKAGMRVGTRRPEDPGLVEDIEVARRDDRARRAAGVSTCLLRRYGRRRSRSAARAGRAHRAGGSHLAGARERGGRADPRSRLDGRGKARRSRRRQGGELSDTQSAENTSSRVAKRRKPPRRAP